MFILLHTFFRLRRLVLDVQLQPTVGWETAVRQREAALPARQDFVQFRRLAFGKLRLTGALETLAHEPKHMVKRMQSWPVILQGCLPLLLARYERHPSGFAPSAAACQVAVWRHGVVDGLESWTQLPIQAVLCWRYGS